MEQIYSLGRSSPWSAITSGRFLAPATPAAGCQTIRQQRLGCRCRYAAWRPVCLRHRPVKTLDRSIRSPRRRPASLSTTATAADEGQRGCRQGGRRATAAVRRTELVPRPVAGKHTYRSTSLRFHGERVGVKTQCRRPARVAPRPLSRCADHSHIG